MAIKYLLNLVFYLFIYLCIVKEICEFNFTQYIRYLENLIYLNIKYYLDYNFLLTNKYYISRNSSYFNMLFSA